MGKRQFNSFEEQLDFERFVGLPVQRKPGDVGIVFGALKALVNKDEEQTQEVVDRVRDELMGQVRFERL